MADYVSKVDVIYQKGNELPETVEYRNDDSIGDENSSDENSEDEEMVENGNTASDLIHIARMEQNISTGKSLKSYVV